MVSQADTTSYTLNAASVFVVSNGGGVTAVRGLAFVHRDVGRRSKQPTSVFAPHLFVKAEPLQSVLKLGTVGIRL